MNKPTLSKSRRIKKTIFTDRLEEQGLSAYTVYAQTLLPSGFKNTLFFSNIERAKIASFHDSFGVGKRKVKRPFFSIGNDEEDKLKDEFAKFFYSQVGI